MRRVFVVALAFALAIVLPLVATAALDQAFSHSPPAMVALAEASAIDEMPTMSVPIDRNGNMVSTPSDRYLIMEIPAAALPPVRAVHQLTVRERITMDKCIATGLSASSSRPTRPLRI